MQADVIGEKEQTPIGRRNSIGACFMSLQRIGMANFM